MYEASDIEYVGRVPGGVEVVLIDRVGYEVLHREQRTLELSFDAMKKLWDEYAAIFLGKEGVT